VLTLAATLDASVTVAGNPTPAVNGTCNYENTSFAFSTANTDPHTGNVYAPANLNTGFGSVAGVGTLNTAVQSGGNPGGTTGNPVTCGAMNATLGGPNPGFNEVALWFGTKMLPTDGAAFDLSLDDARLTVGAASNLDVIDAADPFTLEGTITGTVGSSDADINVEPAGFGFTEFEGEFPAGSGNPLKVSLEPVGDVTGDYDAVSGSMTLDAQITSVITAGNPPAAGYTCEITPIPFALDTDKPASPSLSLPAGSPFTGLAGNGALQTNWPELPDAVDTDGMAPANECDSLINNLVTPLPGGLWITKGINPNPPVIDDPPIVQPQPKPKPKKCKKGFKKKKVKGKVKCVKAKKKKKK
jgi:hypothetical protein